MHCSVVFIVIHGQHVLPAAGSDHINVEHASRHRISGYCVVDCLLPQSYRLLFCHFKVVLRVHDPKGKRRPGASAIEVPAYARSFTITIVYARVVCGIKSTDHCADRHVSTALRMKGADKEL
eukprot:XP_001705164.1 Hypothetical protein GL50803_31436 [Giardia lamblia ATCC 50803]